MRNDRSEIDHFFRVTGYFNSSIYAQRAGYSINQYESGSHNSADVREVLSDILMWLESEARNEGAYAWSINRRHGNILANALRKHLDQKMSLNEAFGYTKNIAKGGAKWSKRLEHGVCAVPFLLLKEREIEARLTKDTTPKTKMKNIMHDALILLRSDEFSFHRDHVSVSENLTEKSLEKLYRKVKPELDDIWNRAEYHAHLFYNLFRNSRVYTQENSE